MYLNTNYIPHSLHEYFVTNSLFSSKVSVLVYQEDNSDSEKHAFHTLLVQYFHFFFIYNHVVISNYVSLKMLLIVCI